MKEIAQIRKLSLWIFLIPLLAINLCLIISQNPEFLENTFFSVDQIGRSAFSIPYLDGSLSISRASRTFPQYLIFKPAMFLTAVFLFIYWKNNNQLVNNLNSTNEVTEIITSQPSNIPHDFELEKRQSTNKQFKYHNQILNKRPSNKKCISPDTITTKKTSSRLSSWNIVEDVYDDIHNDIHNDEYEKYNEVFEN